jgi:hypothetical protein
LNVIRRVKRGEVFRLFAVVRISLTGVPDRRVPHERVSQD